MKVLGSFFEYSEDEKGVSDYYDETFGKFL